MDEKTQNICKRYCDKNCSEMIGGGKMKYKRRTGRIISRKTRLKNSRSRKDFFDNIK